ncbi:hypothetical protein V6259_19260 [Marinomonas sp. TI.3.20]|uniref:hypothetical protein n=1 Tax=Marinomonas sp. TI.3.20 TaxID=3121296 RepID=UPI00311E7F6F
MNIKKLIFSGESFYPAKREYIRNIWPDAEFYSLYGATECGLVAVETPKDQESLHFIFEDWFMLEEGIDGSLYVTDLKEPLIPIIRYCIGDKGQLIKMKDGTTKLLLKGRNDTSFNCGGALIQHESIVKKIRNISEMANLGEDDVQIILKNGENGKDILKIVVNHDASNKPDMIYKIRDMVCSIKEISEDVNRGAVELLVNGPLNLIITRRNKTPQIIDYRHKR